MRSVAIQLAHEATVGDVRPLPEFLQALLETMPPDLASLARGIADGSFRVGMWDVSFLTEDAARGLLVTSGVDNTLGKEHDHFLGIGHDGGEVMAVVGWSPGRTETVYELDGEGAKNKGALGAWMTHLALSRLSDLQVAGQLPPNGEGSGGVDELLCMQWAKDEDGYQVDPWEPPVDVQEQIRLGGHKQWLDMVVPVSVYNKGLRFLVDGKRKVKNAKINVWQVASDPAGRYVLLSEWGREWTRIDLPSGGLRTYAIGTSVSALVPLGGDLFAGFADKDPTIWVFSALEKRMELVTRFPTGLRPTNLSSIVEDKLVLVADSYAHRSLVLAWTGDTFAVLGGANLIMPSFHRVGDRYYGSWFHLPTLGKLLAISRRDG